MGRIRRKLNLPGSESNPGGGCCDNGPGVLPLPGDRASSFIAPPYDSDELGGLCNNINIKSIIYLSFKILNRLNTKVALSNIENQ